MKELPEYKIPSDIFCSDELGRKEKLLFGYFYTYFLRYKEGCTATNAQLSYIIGTDKSAISKSIKKLKEKNLIETKYKNETPINNEPKEIGVADLFQKQHKIPYHNIVRTVFISESYIKSTKSKRRRRKK